MAWPNWTSTAFSSDFKTIVTDKEPSEIVLQCFTYLLIALGIIMILKLYFQTVFIFAKYFPIVTLPFYVIGAWSFSALLFYLAWDLGFPGAQDYLMGETYAAFIHQGLLVGAVFLMIAPFTLLMPRLRFGRSSSDNEGCCKTICFPTFVWVVFLFIVLLCTFSGYSVYCLLKNFYGLPVFNCLGVSGIYVLLVLFYLFSLFQILAQRKIIVSGDNILGELRKPFKCLHSRPYLFVYISVLVFFALAALGLVAFYAVKAYDKYKSSSADTKNENMAIIGAFSGMAALYVLIGMTLGLVISCSRSYKPHDNTHAASYTAQPDRTPEPEMNEPRAHSRNPYSTVTENSTLGDRASYHKRDQYIDNNIANNNTIDSIRHNTLYNDGSIRSGTLELKTVNQSPKTVSITMQHSDGSKSNLGAIRAFPHTTLADARILTRTLPNAPQDYVFICRNREVSEPQEAEFTIYGLEELILAVETVC